MKNRTVLLILVLLTLLALVYRFRIIFYAYGVPPTSYYESSGMSGTTQYKECKCQGISWSEDDRHVDGALVTYCAGRVYACTERQENVRW